MFYIYRHGEYSDYPPIDGVVPVFQSDWMYLIVDEVKLTARSPNPYIESQTPKKWNYGNALKITTSSHSSIGSGSGHEREESEDLSKYLLTCYICGDEFNCQEFLLHESNCRNVRKTQFKPNTTDSETQTPRTLTQSEISELNFTESSGSVSQPMETATITTPVHRFYRVNYSPSFFPLFP